MVCLQLLDCYLHFEQLVQFYKKHLTPFKIAPFCRAQNIGKMSELEMNGFSMVFGVLVALFMFIFGILGSFFYVRRALIYLRF